MGTWGNYPGLSPELGPVCAQGLLCMDVSVGDRPQSRHVPVSACHWAVRVWGQEAGAKYGCLVAGEVFVRFCRSA
jgi:hypothetical protein